MKGFNSNSVILLTAAINPNSKEVLSISDPEIRKHHYIEAINFYLSNTNLNIVFTENSNTSLKDFFEPTSRLEFLTFSSPFVKPDKGKGYKELEIIDYSMKNSRFIANATGVVKITGRLKVLNINRLNRQIQSQTKLANSVVLSNIYKESKMDSRCFYFTKDFWPILQKNGQLIDLSFSFERALWKGVLEYTRLHQGLYKQFVQPLRIEGISGGMGVAYRNGWFITVAKKLRHYLTKEKYLKHFKN
ncbi:MAG: hypothetical protein ABGW97_16730 [Christiangramia sp.]|uniref:hypothetical protein n=1 Tax=Christiangramia sp. TaxID=1931228 RepID=UPI003242F633